MQWTDFRQRIRHFSAADQARIQKAYEMGKEAHEDQKRRSGDPYFTHPLAVAEMLITMGADSDTVLVALLHDTIEDTSITLADIEQAFGTDIAKFVDGITKLDEEEFREQPTLDEQTETLRKIFTFMERDVRIMVLKIVDRLHNMQTAQFLDVQRQKEIAQETLDVYAKIADRLCLQDLRSDLEASCMAVLEPELLAALVEKERENEKAGGKMIAHMESVLQKGAARNFSDKIEIRYERKPWEKRRQRQEREGDAITGVSAITAVFICEDIPTCYAVFGALHQAWQREILSFEDFINAPMVNGYRGLHTTIILEDGTRVRCKIRTAAMHEYAHRGITVRCFDEKAKGLLDYLPWTERLATLSADTTDRSEQFWQSLQSDILGKSIIIHGPNDKTIALPRGATALDGALYLFPEKGLHTTSIRIDGKEVSFSTPLEHAASLDLTLANKLMVERAWLEWTTTGFATATIRAALARQSKKQQLKIGEQLLREAMQKQGKGFIEEFDQEGILRRLEQIGYSSLEETYAALADGHINPEEVIAGLFRPLRDSAVARKRHCIIQYTMHIATTENLHVLLQIYQQCSVHCRTLKIKMLSPTELGVTVHAFLSQDLQKRLLTNLQIAGAQSITIRTLQPLLWGFSAIFLLITLWGLDPVFARHILAHYITAVDLTVVRFVAFFLAATLFYFFHGYFSVQKYTPLSPRNPALIVSGFALFCTGFFSYLALTYISAIQYILFIIGGITFTTLLKSVRQRGSVWWRMLATVLMIALFIAILTNQQEYSVIGLLLAGLSACAFSLYSMVSNFYQRDTIHARYPAYLFWLSAIALLPTFLLVPFTNFTVLSPWALMKVFGFVFVFSIIPYGLYFECTRRMQTHLVTYTLPFVMISTIVGEVFYTGSFLPLVAAPLLLVFFWQYFKTEYGDHDIS